MALPGLPPKPDSTPLSSPDGRLSPPWSRWLDLLRENVRAAVSGGGGGSGLTTAGTGLEESPAGTVNLSAANVTKLAGIEDGATNDTADIAALAAADVVLAAAIAGKLDTNTPISGATKTKITYDADGLVTAGADATTADIADSTNKRYVSDAQLVVIGNTSGTNTGDQSVSIGTFGAAPDAKAATASGMTVTIQPADATHPGAVSVGTQVWGGAKTADALTASTGDVKATAGNLVLGAVNAWVGASALGCLFWDDVTTGKAFLNTKSDFIVNLDSNANDSTANAAFRVRANTSGTGGSDLFIIFKDGTATMNGVALLSQTNSVASISNKSFTTPGIAGATLSGTLSGNATLSGNLTLSGSNGHSGLMTRTGGIKASTRITTATTVTMGAADEVILAGTAGGAVTVNLQAAATAGAGRKLTVVNTGGGSSVTLDGSGSETINGSLTKALAAQYNKVTIISDGTNWLEVA